MRLIDADAAIDFIDVGHLCNPNEPRWSDNEIVNFLKSRPSAQSEQRWIPCSERLPEDKKAVYWACNDNGHQFECRWTNANHFWTEFTTDWHWNLFDVPQYSKVVAWMPLPEPYKEKDDETD